MVGLIFPATAVSGAPSNTGATTRAALSALVAGATAARPFGGITGLRPGTPASIVTATSTTWTVTPFAGYIDLEASGTNGGYFFEFGGNETGSVTAAGASPRTDILSVQLNDSTAGDGSSGSPNVALVYNANTTTPPSRAFVIAQINVPASGGGSPTVTWVSWYTAAAGSAVPVLTAAIRDAQNPTPAQGQRVFRVDLGYEETYLSLYNVTTNPSGASTAGWYRTLPSARAKMSQRTNNTTWAVGNVSAYDTTEAVDCTYSSGVVTIVRPGTYLVMAQSKQNTSSAYNLMVKVNGTGAIASSNSAGAQYAVVGLQGYLRLVPGDQVVLAVGNNPISTQTDSPADNNFLEIVQVAS